MTLIQTFTDNANRLKSFDVEVDLIQTIHLGAFGFDDLRSKFQEVRVLVDRLVGLDLHSLPVDMLAGVNAHLTNILSFYEQIRELGRESALGIIEKRVKELKQQVSQTIGSFIPYSIQVISYHELVVGKQHFFETASLQLTNLSSHFDRMAKEAQEKVDSVLLDVQTLQETLRAQSKDLGITKYSQIFQQESDFHKKQSQNWLIAIVVLLVSTLTYGIISTNSLEATADLDKNNYVLLLTITRVVIITVLFYALAISIKNYKAHKHNQVINRHRHNALVTFETFSTAASNDPDTKNAILLEATRAIFGNTSTGYTLNDADDLPSNKVIEIFKSVKEKG